jgi:ATP-dependent Clp protease ATP-binding subunit ClpA
MTTNAGAADMQREGVGFGAGARVGEDEEAIKRMFTPEFRNRLDATVPFDYLPPSIVARVIDKFIIQLELQLAERDVHIALEPQAKDWLIERGYDRLYGARPLGRLIQESIKRPLADELLFGKLVNGGEVRVHIKDDKPAFEIISAAPKPKRGKKKVAALPAPSEEKD